MDGSINVESSTEGPETGTTFIVTFKTKCRPSKVVYHSIYEKRSGLQKLLQIEEEKKVPLGEVFQVPNTREMPQLEKKKLKRVLVADDNQFSLVATQSMMEKKGEFTVSAVENGADAVERVRAEHFDMVLLDLDMPLKNGYEAAMEISGNIGKSAPMVVAFSGMEENLDDLRGYGFDDMVEKPLDQKKLRYLIKRLDTFDRVQHGNKQDGQCRRLD